MLFKKITRICNLINNTLIYACVEYNEKPFSIFWSTKQYFTDTFCKLNRSSKYNIRLFSYYNCLKYMKLYVLRLCYNKEPLVVKKCTHVLIYIYTSNDLSNKYCYTLNGYLSNTKIHSCIYITFFNNLMKNYRIILDFNILENNYS